MRVALLRPGQEAPEAVVTVSGETCSMVTENAELQARWDFMCLQGFEVVNYGRSATGAPTSTITRKPMTVANLADALAHIAERFGLTFEGGWTAPAPEPPAAEVVTHPAPAESKPKRPLFRRESRK